MAKKREKNLIVGLDIGTSKIVALVGEVANDGGIDLIGYGTHPSTGLKRGVVVDIDSTVQSIQRAVEEAELMSGCQIHSAYTGIAGSHIRSMNSHGIVAIRSAEVMPYDLEKVIEAAKAVAIPADQQIIHVLPQEFIIDNQDGIKQPIGMSGVRLESRVHMVTGSVSAAQNIVKCVGRCGLEVSNMILEQLASSYAVLTEDEKELGVCMIDIGGGTTDIAVFTDGALRHTAVIPIAGDQVTNDIAIALRTPTQAAETIKLNHACALGGMVAMDEMVDVPCTNDRPDRKISRKMLTEVVEARYEELFRLVQAELRRSGFEDLIAAGIVLTGGASKVAGGIELAEVVFSVPTRLGIPTKVRGMPEIIENPIYSTAIGLLLFGFEQENTPHMDMPMRPGVKGVFGRVKSWFQGNF
ncbi:MAG: cell division protein FtsA [Legionellales bacterium]|nr:cell division protein FtsA [Legionellales bacterium]